MGLSTKQGPREDQVLGWSEALMHSSSNLNLITKPAASTRRNQQQQQVAEHLECPRCGSMNTKFCYYNNYNKSQPRHFCKACKRHWTKGGSLRNVPIGGARKNKGIKLPNNAKCSTFPKSGTINGDAHIFVQSSQKNGCNNVLFSEQKGISDTLFHSLINPPSSFQNDEINSFLGKSFMVSNGSSSSSSILWPSQDQSMQFSLSNTKPSPITSQKSKAYDHQFGRLDTSLESTITSWQNPTSGAMNLSNYWSWNDMNPLVSSADLHIPLSDTEIGFF